MKILSSWGPSYPVPKYIAGERMPAADPHGLTRGVVINNVETEFAPSSGYHGAEGFGDMGATDAVIQYGANVANAIIRNMRKVPLESRTAATKAVLDTLDKDLWDKVAKRADTLTKTKGMSPPVALETAMALSVADGFVGQMVKVGQTKTIKPASLSGLASLGDTGLGCACTEYAQRLYGDPVATGSLWGDISGAVKSAVKSVGKEAKKIGNSALKEAEKYGTKALKEVEAIGCKALNSNAVRKAVATAAGAAATFAGGGPIAGAGASMAANKGLDAAKGVCSSKKAQAIVQDHAAAFVAAQAKLPTAVSVPAVQQAVMMQVAPTSVPTAPSVSQKPIVSGSNSMVLLGGAALLAVLLMSRNK